MRRFLLGLVALVAIGMSFPVAQQIQRSVQLSQDPTGPIGFDTRLGVYFPGKLYSGSNQTTPTVSSCGTSPTILGSDLAGQVTTGSAAATTCTVTWSVAYASSPYCVANPRTASAVGVIATPNGMQLVLGGLNSMPINYHCIGQQP